MRKLAKANTRRYRELIQWVKQRLGKESSQATLWLDGILRLEGFGRRLWGGEDPDEYVRKLSEDW